jgi:glutamate synthase (NADPH/NADH) small chain
VIFRVSSAHEEGGERLYSVSTQRFSGDAAGHVRRLHAVQVEPRRGGGSGPPVEPVPGTEFEIPADLVLLAMGFTGASKMPLLDELGVTVTDRNTVARDAQWMTNVAGVFVAGDVQRGQSLIVWAIAEGRSAARAIDQFLMGESQLPAPLP